MWELRILPLTMRFPGSLHKAEDNGERAGGCVWTASQIFQVRVTTDSFLSFSDSFLLQRKHMKDQLRNSFQAHRLTGESLLVWSHGSHSCMEGAWRQRCFFLLALLQENWPPGQFWDDFWVSFLPSVGTSPLRLKWTAGNHSVGPEHWRSQIGYLSCKFLARVI